MARSREEVRQNKAMQSILRGETPEKRVMVGYDKKEEKQVGDKIDPISEVMKEVRMPWFCPKCKKVMKKRLDNKIWFIYNHCFDCQIDFENRLRIEGKYQDWIDNKVKTNKLAWIKDQKESIKEWMTQQTPEIYNQVNPNGYSLDKEKWNMNSKDIQKKAEEALEYLEKLEESIL